MIMFNSITPTPLHTGLSQVSLDSSAASEAITKTPHHVEASAEKPAKKDDDNLDLQAPVNGSKHAGSTAAALKSWSVQQAAMDSASILRVLYKAFQGLRDSSRMVRATEGQAARAALANAAEKIREAAGQRFGAALGSGITQLVVATTQVVGSVMEGKGVKNAVQEGEAAIKALDAPDATNNIAADTLKDDTLASMSKSPDVAIANKPDAAGDTMTGSTFKQAGGAKPEIETQDLSKTAPPPAPQAASTPASKVSASTSKQASSATSDIKTQDLSKTPPSSAPQATSAPDTQVEIDHALKPSANNNTNANGTANATPSPNPGSPSPTQVTSKSGAKADTDVSDKSSVNTNTAPKPERSTEGVDKAPKKPLTKEERQEEIAKIEKQTDKKIKGIQKGWDTSVGVLKGAFDGTAKLVDANLQHSASKIDAEKFELENLAKALELRAQAAGDDFQNSYEQMRGVRDVLQSMAQQDSEVNRGISRNI